MCDMPIPATPRSFEVMLSDMRPLFWDVQVDALDRHVNAPFIISRLLNMGGMAGYCWVKDLFSEDEIRDAVAHRRDMRPIVRNFMAQRYAIPREDLVTTPRWR